VSGVRCFALVDQAVTVISLCERREQRDPMQKILDCTQTSLNEAFAALAKNAQRQRKLYLAVVGALMAIVIVSAFLVVALAIARQLDYRRSFATRFGVNVALLLHAEVSFLRRTELAVQYSERINAPQSLPAGVEASILQTGMALRLERALTALSATYDGDTPTALVSMSLPVDSLFERSRRPESADLLLLLSDNRRVVVSSPPVDATTASMLATTAAEMPEGAYKYTRDGVLMRKTVIPGLGSIVGYLSWSALLAAMSWQLRAPRCCSSWASFWLRVSGGCGCCIRRMRKPLVRSRTRRSIMCSSAQPRLGCALSAAATFQSSPPMR
jgi:hypothetical protein